MKSGLPPWGLAILLCLNGACGTEGEASETPREVDALDLYLYPVASTENFVPQRLSAITLSSLEAEAPEIAVDTGVLVKYAVTVSKEIDGQSAVNFVTANVLATADTGMIYKGTVEAGDATNVHTLRLPQGVYDLSITPFDSSLPPVFLSDTPIDEGGETAINIPVDTQISGVIRSSSDTLPLEGVTLLARRVEGITRGSSIDLSDANGAFDLLLTPGEYTLWGQRDISAQGADEGDLSPIQSQYLGLVSVPEGGIGDLDLEMVEAETSELVGQVVYQFDQYLSDVTIRAIRDNSGFEGALTVSTSTGARANLGSGVFALDLPAGQYRLEIEPPLTTYETLASVDYPKYDALTLPAAGNLPDISIFDTLVNLRGELSLDDSPVRAVGTSLLFFPESDLQSTISSQAEGDQATFEVSVQPPGRPPIALAPGSHRVWMVPPLGHHSVNQEVSFSVVTGQSALELPSMQSGFAVYGQLDSQYANAVVKAVLPGDDTYAEKWGPGPDPTSVIAEGVVDGNGLLTLYLPL